MLADKNKDTVLFCFSPPVMVATFLVEMFLLLRLANKRLNAVGRLAAIIILLLATFQLAEFQVCRGTSPVLWAKIGFVAITLLPALGLDIMSRLARTRPRKLVLASYAAAILFAIVIVAKINIHPICTSNYAIFRLSPGFGFYYSLYYFGLIILGLFTALSKPANRKSSQAQHLMILGYIAFLVPTAIVLYAKASTLNGVPSIMCGFAVLFALVLSFGVIPIVGLTRKK